MAAAVVVGDTSPVLPSLPPELQPAATSRKSARTATDRQQAVRCVCFTMETPQ
jgi:hypothetical protein